MACHVDDEIRQNVVVEMLAEQLGNHGGVAFTLMASEGDDTSDPLLSPYLGTAQARDGVKRVVRWANDLASECTLAIFLSEGYDDHFVLAREDVVLEAIAEEHWIPSVKMEFSRGQTAVSQPRRTEP
jgi:hypothetical protein